MFEDLNWRSAARRSAVVVGIYLALVYILSTVSPDTFGLQNRQEIISVLVQAVFFFFIFTLVYALVERNRNRRLDAARKKTSKPADENPETSDDSLKGRPNPNTSRKKARRKR
jgi:hypothetical protein